MDLGPNKHTVKRKYEITVNFKIAIFDDIEE